MMILITCIWNPFLFHFLALLPLLLNGIMPVVIEGSLKISL